VLLGGLSSGPLPPLSGPSVSTPRSRTAEGVPRSKSLAPRIAELSSRLGSGSDERDKAICSELALLASRSLTACIAVADAKLEPQLSKLLLSSKDPTTQCWIMSILSNCAGNRACRERQAVAVPALCSLIASPVPEVQHAATLHLATLSHSSALTMAISSNRKSMNALHAIEVQKSTTLAGPACAALRQEASQYARWALRTSQGRNYKPAYVPKTKEQLEQEASIQVQARVRSSFVANQYRNEMKARRVAAVVVQGAYRGHQGRTTVAAQLLVEGPAAALLQGVVRGRKERKRMSQGLPMDGEDGTDDDKATPSAMATSGSGDDTLVLCVKCSDGTLEVPLALGGGSADGLDLGLSVLCSDGSLALGIVIHTYDDASLANSVVETLFLNCSDGTLRLRLNLDC